MELKTDVEDAEAAEIGEDLGCALDLGPAADPDLPKFKDDEYPIYDDSNSRMISGPIGVAKYLGTRFSTWQEAKSHVYSKYKVCKFWVWGYRWYARIKK